MLQIEHQTLKDARAGDETALAAVIAHMMPRIRQSAKACVAPGLDFDDAVQEGLIGLFQAVKTYQDGQDASFETYATTCIRNAQFSARRTAGRKKHGPLNHSIPLPEDTAAPGPEELVLANEAYIVTLEKLDSALSPMEKNVLALHLDGRSTAQSATLLGITPKAVENALGRVRRKLKSG